MLKAKSEKKMNGWLKLFKVDHSIIWGFASLDKNFL